MSYSFNLNQLPQNNSHELTAFFMCLSLRNIFERRLEIIWHQLANSCKHDLATETT